MVTYQGPAEALRTDIFRFTDVWMTTCYWLLTAYYTIQYFLNVLSFIRVLSYNRLLFFIFFLTARVRTNPVESAHCTLFSSCVSARLTFRFVLYWWRGGGKVFVLPSTLWCPPFLLFSEYRGKAAGIWSWPLHPYFLPQLRMSGYVPPLHVCF